MFQFCCVIAEARWSRDSPYLSYKAVVSGVCVCYTRQQCRETVSIHTGSSVGRLVQLWRIFWRSEYEESKTKVRDLESRRKKSSGSDMD